MSYNLGGERVMEVNNYKSAMTYLLEQAASSKLGSQQREKGEIKRRTRADIGTYQFDKDTQ